MVSASNAPVYTGAACWRAAAPKPPQERTLARPFLLSRLRRLLPIQAVKGTGRIFSAALRKSPPLNPLTVWIFAVHGPRRRRGTGLHPVPPSARPLYGKTGDMRGAAPRPGLGQRTGFFHRPSSRWRSWRLSCPDIPRMRSALLLAVISSIIFARAFFSSG